ncbi:hypothetical protein ACFV97_13865 [Streptomyces sp. NPDC059913]|uniref:hypothetical protein n=1 Tax=unclassified Streptomyces TaxID=2593676 RepID=UPI003661D43F
MARGRHVDSLRVFGAAITSDGPTITLQGPSALTAAHVAGEGIRPVAALLTAALAADGISTIKGLCHLQREYSALLPKLAALGAELTQH